MLRGREKALFSQGLDKGLGENGPLAPSICLDLGGVRVMLLHHGSFGGDGLASLKVEVVIVFLDAANVDTMLLCERSDACCAGCSFGCGGL